MPKQSIPPSIGQRARQRAARRALDPNVKEYQATAHSAFARAD